jgi:hypothetical protein
MQIALTGLLLDGRSVAKKSFGLPVGLLYLCSGIKCCNRLRSSKLCSLLINPASR